MDDYTNTIHKIGLSKCSREHIDLFSQAEAPNKILLGEQMPDIDEIISLMVSPEIISVESTGTVKKEFEDKQILAYKRIIVRVRVYQKILYTSSSQEQSMHVLENQCNLNCSIMVPYKIECADPDLLIKNKILTPCVYIEDVSIIKLNGRSIFENIFALVVLDMRPTYELCCSIYDGDNFGNIFIMFGDGSNMVQKTHCKNLIVKNPIWLSSGNDIAFVASDDISDCLCLTDINIDYQKYLIKPSVFKRIESLCSLNHKIIFSGVKEKTRQIFSIDIDNPVCKQLTYTDSIIESFNPKCSSDEKNIGFLRSISGVSDLWLMDESGLELRKITSSGHIKDFDWSHSGDTVIYIEENSIDPDKIIMKNLKISKDTCILKSSYPCIIRKILCSPADDVFALINSTETKEDIYIYRLQEQQLINITNNPDNVKIGDISWKTDGSKLYYSCNELEYFNIYSVSLSDYRKHQLTSIRASNVELSYKAKII